jgi:hypothetical protein
MKLGVVKFPSLSQHTVKSTDLIKKLLLWQPLLIHRIQTYESHFLAECWYQHKYKGLSKIFRTVAAIYTAVLVARSTGGW